MQQIDKLLYRQKSKMPKFICYIDAEGEPRNVLLIDFLLMIQVHFMLEDFPVLDSSIPDVIRQLEAMPEGLKRDALFGVIDCLHERQEAIAHVETS